MRASKPIAQEELIWEPTEKQALFIECPCEDVLFGGARGPGKTIGLLGDWMMHANKYGQHARGLLFRRSYPELEEIEQQCHDIYPKLGATYRVKNKQWNWVNGAQLRLRYLDKDEDASKYQGHSATWMGVDELTHWPSPEGLDKIRATLRSGVGVPTFFRGTANPGGPGHGWVKQRYIDPSPPNTPFYARIPYARGDYITIERCFIPATLDDNPYLVQNDPDYWKRVVAATADRPDLLKAWRYGEWDIVAGGAIDDVWNRDYHVLAPFDVPPHWYVDRSFDWGSSKPFCVLWFAESNGEMLPDGRSWPRGSLFVIAEDYGWTGKVNEGLYLDEESICERIKDREIALDLRVRPGPADLPRDIRQGISMEDVMRRHGVAWTKPSKGAGSRITGLQRIRKRLQNAATSRPEEPGLYIFDRCTNLIRTLPMLPRDPKRLDDVDTAAEDHAYDALRLRVLAERSTVEAFEVTF